MTIPDVSEALSTVDSHFRNDFYSHLPPSLFNQQFSQPHTPKMSTKTKREGDEERPKKSKKTSKVADATVRGEMC